MKFLVSWCGFSSHGLWLLAVEQPRRRLQNKESSWGLAAQHHAMLDFWLMAIACTLSSFSLSYSSSGSASAQLSIEVLLFATLFLPALPLEGLHIPADQLMLPTLFS